MKRLVVTVDGPGGTGKSTVSKAVAKRLGLPHLDTGAYYRAATLAAMRSGADPADLDSVLQAVGNVRLSQVDGRTMLDGEDVSEEIREQVVTAQVSAVSAHPEVRRRLVALQRDWVAGNQGRAVVEGRDIGSVVFPGAEVKIYLDARPEVRARRRALQDRSDPEAVLDELLRRDHLDSTRETSPLTVPPGAHVVDTSDLSFDQVVDRVVEIVAAAG